MNRHEVEYYFIYCHQFLFLSFIYFVISKVLVCICYRLTVN